MDFVARLCKYSLILNALHYLFHLKNYATPYSYLYSHAKNYSIPSPDLSIMSSTVSCFIYFSSTTLHCVAIHELAMYYRSTNPSLNFISKISLPISIALSSQDHQLATLMIISICSVDFSGNQIMIAYPKFVVATLLLRSLSVVSDVMIMLSISYVITLSRNALIQEVAIVNVFYV